MRCADIGGRAFLTRVLAGGATLALLCGCRGERLAGTPAGRLGGTAQIVLQSVIEQPGARQRDLTAYTTVFGRTIVLGEARVPIDTGRRNVPFTVDLVPCFGADSSATPVCALALSGVLRDSTMGFLDSAQVGPITLHLTDSVATFPPLNLRRVARIGVTAAASNIVIGDTCQRRLKMGHSHRLKMGHGVGG